MRFHRYLFAGMLAIPLSFIIPAAQATPVTGVANIAGNVSVNGTSVNFAPTFTNTAGAMETGDFAGLTGGTIMSLSSNGGAQTGNISVPGFVTFSTGLANPITFDLTYIAPGVGTAGACNSSALGAECTPAGSPFTLFQISSNTVLVSLQLNGNSYTGLAATGTSFTRSIFSTQTAINGTIPQIIAQLSGGGSVQGITYSASFEATPSTSSVPEPASLVLMGVGLMGAGIIARRKTAKS